MAQEIPARSCSLPDGRGRSTTGSSSESSARPNSEVSNRFLGFSAFLVLLIWTLVVLCVRP